MIVVPGGGPVVSGGFGHMMFLTEGIKQDKKKITINFDYNNIYLYIHSFCLVENNTNKSINMIIISTYLFYQSLQSIRKTCKNKTKYM